MSHKFKVGDKVICMPTGSGDPVVRATIGRNAEIESVSDLGGMYVVGNGLWSITALEPELKHA